MLLKALSLLCCLLLTTISSFATRSVSAKTEIMLTYSSYNKLSESDKIKYLGLIRQSYLNFEKQYWGIKKVSIFAFLESTAYAASKWLNDKCTIGGRILKVNDNGLCPTFGLGCDGKEDGFRCGKIFNSACIERIPKESISERCNIEAEVLAKAGRAITKETYNKIRTQLLTATQMCGPEIPSACDILKNRINKIDTDLGAKAVAALKQDGTQSPLIPKACQHIEFESAKDASSAPTYRFTVQIGEQNRSWVDDDGVLAMLNLRHKAYSENNDILKKEEKNFVLSIYQEIVAKGKLNQMGCSDAIVKKSIEDMKTLLVEKGDNPLTNDDSGLTPIFAPIFTPIEEIAKCMTFARLKSVDSQKRSHFGEILRVFRAEDLKQACPAEDPKTYLFRGPWAMPQLPSPNDSVNDSVGNGSRKVRTNAR